MNNDDDKYNISKQWIQQNTTVKEAELLESTLVAVVSQLELLVGNRLATYMTDDQLDVFVKLVDSGDEDASLEYLENVVPNYKDIVGEEVDGLKQLLKSVQDTTALQSLIETWK